MNLNKVFVLGNLTRDPESRSLPSGLSVASFNVATNRFFNAQNGQKQQEVEYHNIVAFGKLADVVSNYLSKGNLVLVEGRLKTRNWDDKDGGKKYKTEIMAEKIQLGPKKYSSGTGQIGSSQSQNDNIPIIEEQEEEIDVKDIPL